MPGLRPLSACLALGCALAAHSATVENVRVWAEDGRTRVVLDLRTVSGEEDETLLTLLSS